MGEICRERLLQIERGAEIPCFSGRYAWKGENGRAFENTRVHNCDIVPIESVAIFAKLLVQYSLDKATNGGVADK